tara:strand:+ start:7495 stop:7809 length:315 start_codon:yes stop_codon:yes gene_type:complete
VERAEKHADQAEIENQQPKDLIMLRIPEMNIMYEVRFDLTLNEAEAGVNVSKASGLAICGACRVKVVHGEYDMNHNGGISKEEIAEGYVLSCCTRVKSDIEIEL